MKHIYHRCTRREIGRCSGCHGDDGRDCMYEALSVCSVCGAYEGALLPFCPGRALTFDEQEAHYKHYCARTGPFAVARFKTIEAAKIACEEYHDKDAGSMPPPRPGSRRLLDAVCDLYALEAEQPLCAICSTRHDPKNGGVVEPAHEWICNPCLIGKVCP